MTTYIVVVGIVYNLLLAGLEGGISLVWVNGVLHVAIPIYAAIDWIFFGDRSALRWSKFWIVLVYPIVWIVVVLIRGNPLVRLTDLRLVSDNRNRLHSTTFTPPDLVHTIAVSRSSRDHRHCGRGDCWHRRDAVARALPGRVRQSTRGRGHHPSDRAGHDVGDFHQLRDAR